jgi:hypothetical protein
MDHRGYFDVEARRKFPVTASKSNPSLKVLRRNISFDHVFGMHLHPKNVCF